MILINKVIEESGDILIVNSEQYGTIKILKMDESQYDIMHRNKVVPILDNKWDVVERFGIYGFVI